MDMQQMLTRFLLLASQDAFVLCRKYLLSETMLLPLVSPGFPGVTKLCQLYSNTLEHSLPKLFSHLVRLPFFFPWLIDSLTDVRV